MKKFPLKLKIIFIGSIFLFMFIYMFVFGKNNAAIGLTMAMAAFMNLGNDLSFKPKTSFIRLSILFLILGFGAYLNNPISIFACILTFFIVFATTFTSYHLFGSDVYLPFLMAYFMMIAYPVSFEELPLRGISLIFGAAFILALNLLVNKNKDYKLSKETMDRLILEIDKAIDLKLDGKEVSRESFKIVNNFYSSLFNKFEYKYFPSSKQESALNIVKSFQYIGFILSDYDLSGDELTYIKRILTKIDDISPDEIFKSVKVESDGMYLVLLNLEIIANEIKNKDLTKEMADIKSLKSLFKPLVKYCFSFRSAKFTFAFKMAIVLTLLEVLTLMFNLPYTKWLYLAAIPLMQPYIDDAKFTSKSRLLGTLIGAFIFTILIIICPYLPLSPNEFMIIVMMICVVGMIYEFEKKGSFQYFHDINVHYCFINVYLTGYGN